MKVTFTLALALFFNNLTAQDQDPPCFSETFSGSTNGWTYSQGASIHSYENPANNCSENRGIVTPGVGGNNPCQVKTPSITSNGGVKVKMTFDMFVMNANLKCNTWKDFACPTSMDVVLYVGSTAYQVMIDYTLPPNGPSNSGRVAVTFYVGPNLPAGALYQIEMFFKFKSGVGNCVQQNTKYIFDNFTICDLQEVAERGTNHSIPRSTIRNTITIANDPLLVYPNPTMGASRLNIPHGISLKQICISDMYGRIVKHQTSGNIIDLSGLRKGTYIVRMTKPGGETVSNKLIVN